MERGIRKQNQAARSLLQVNCRLSGALGGDRRGATPVPIPNTAVKPSTGDGTDGAVRWESNKPPGLFTKKIPTPFDRCGYFFCKYSGVRLDERQARQEEFSHMGVRASRRLILVIARPRRGRSNLKS